MQHTILGSLEILRRNNISVEGSFITIPNQGPGIRLWGMLDFLRKQGYTIVRQKR